MTIFLFTNRKEITQAEFEKLLTEIAPKYKAEKKLGSNEEAVAAMKKKLLGGIDATSGTTVNINTV